MILNIIQLSSVIQGLMPLSFTSTRCPAPWTVTPALCPAVQCLSLFLSLWANDFTSPNVSFLICKAGRLSMPPRC